MLNTSMHGITARQIKSLISESDNKKLLKYATRGVDGGGECRVSNKYGVQHMIFKINMNIQ